MVLYKSWINDYWQKSIGYTRAGGEAGFKFVFQSFVFVSLLFLTACHNSSSKNQRNELSTPELAISLEHGSTGEGVGIAKVNFTVSDGWHIYGPLDQQNGRPTKIELFIKDLPLTQLQWPEPKIFDEGASGPSNGYDGRFEVVVNIAHSKLGLSPLKAKIAWVACKNICVPGEAELVLDLK